MTEKICSMYRKVTMINNDKRRKKMQTENPLVEQLMNERGPVDLDFIEKWTELVMGYTVGSPLTFGALQGDNPSVVVEAFKSEVKSIIKESATTLMAEDKELTYYSFTVTAIKIIEEVYARYITFRCSDTLKRGPERIIKPHSWHPQNGGNSHGNQH